MKESKARQRSSLKTDIALELECWEEGWWDWQEDEWEADVGWWPDSQMKGEAAAKRQVIVDPWIALTSRLRRVGGIIEADAFPKSVRCPFMQLQKTFLTEHGVGCCNNLQHCNPGTIHLRPTPLSAEARRRLLDARATLSGSLAPAFHGTPSCNFPSIFEHGLLIPGENNTLDVAHGSAHGKGIYTAKITNPSLSQGFCSDNQLLICGVLDDAVQGAVTEYTLGIRTVSRESDSVRHVGDAMVVFDSRRVAPLFVASLHSGDKPKGLATVTFDWNRHYDRINRVFSNNSPICNNTSFGRPRSRQTEVKPPRNSYYFLRRRAARKRSLKGT